MVRHFRITGLLRTRLEETAVSVAQVLRRAGLPQNLFDQTRILVSTEELFALWRAIAEISQDPTIGLRLATETRTERFHPMSLAALSSDNLGDAIRNMARYKKLSAPEEILHQIANGEWSIRFRWTLALDHEPHALLEHCFAWILTIARIGTKAPISPLRLELIHPRPHQKALERFFGCPVVSGPHNALVFRATDAEIPLLTRNHELLDILAPVFEQELERQATEQTFAELVRDAIQQRLTGRRPTIDNIARDLHLSPRTLQRRLQEDGSTFQRVLDQARHQMARYYLGNSVLELTEAAYLLGYEDTSSFTRAFRTWEGVPPGLWRETNRTPTLQ